MEAANLEALAEQLLAIHLDSYGTGAQDVRVNMIDDAIVVFLDGLELQRNEEFLIEKGREELVLSTRHAYQQSIEATFRAAVERTTGRSVVAFTSNVHLDPNFAVEIFRLAPAEPR